MKWIGKLILIIGILALLAAIAGMIYVVKAKYLVNDYTADVEACFQAALFVNSGELTDDPACSVIAEYRNQSYLIHPQLYQKIIYYIRSQPVPPLFGGASGKEKLKIRICGQSEMEITLDEQSDLAFVSFRNAGRKYFMRVHANRLGAELIRFCTVGSGPYSNLSLD